MTNEEEDGDMMCVICGTVAASCRCASDPGITAAAFALIKTIRSGNMGPQHKARIVEAQKRLVRAQVEAAQR